MRSKQIEKHEMNVYLQWKKCRGLDWSSARVDTKSMKRGTFK